MNKNFDRTKEGGYLIRDSNLEVTRTFYPPNVSDGDELNVGENDPDKVGAIATKTIDGVTGLYIYQGDDVWVLANSGSTPELADGVITPGGVSLDSDSLATFDPQFKYRLSGDIFEPTQADLQLDPEDATYTRIDLIVGTSSGTYEKVTGIAASTYEQPPVPSGTLLLAQIYRMPSGTNVIIINDTGGYILKVGDTMFGRFTVANGNDLVLRAPVGSTGPNEVGRDSGDIIFQWGDGHETRRLYINHGTGDLTIKEEADFDTTYIILNSGNFSEQIPFEDATGIVDIDMTINAASGYGLTKRNKLYLRPKVRAYNTEDLGGGVIKSTEIIGFSSVITETSGVNTLISNDGIFGDGYLLLTN